MQKTVIFPIPTPAGPWSVGKIADESDQPPPEPLLTCEIHPSGDEGVYFALGTREPRVLICRDRQVVGALKPSDVATILRVWREMGVPV